MMVGWQQLLSCGCFELVSFNYNLCQPNNVFFVYLFICFIVAKTSLLIFKMFKFLPPFTLGVDFTTLPNWLKGSCEFDFVLPLGVLHKIQITIALCFLRWQFLFLGLLTLKEEIVHSLLSKRMVGFLKGLQWLLTYISILQQ